VQHAQIRPNKHSWVAKLLGRMTPKQAAIAIANKVAPALQGLNGGNGRPSLAHRPMWAKTRRPVRWIASKTMMASSSRNPLSVV
jgi:hypothetical protein